MPGYFRMEVKVVSRSAVRGNESVAKNSALNAAAYITAEKYEERKADAIEAAAYVSGEKMHLESKEKASDYRHKKGVLESWVMLPENAPKEYEDPEKLWNAVEVIEKAKNADLFREFIICFDKHVGAEERCLVAKEFGQALVNEGMAVHIAIHDEKKGNGNYHMHILAPIRGFDVNGSWDKSKTYPRKYALDEHGQKIPVMDKKTGMQKVESNGRKVWKREPIKYVRAYNDRRLDNVSRWRKIFAEIENRYLPIEYQVSSKSYREQGIDRLPGRHLGKAAYNVHKKLEEQVTGLSPEKRQEYLKRILKQVQDDYCKAYYENSQLIETKIQESKFGISEERKQLQKEVDESLQRVNKYRPQKQYISHYSFFYKSKICLDYAFSRLVLYQRHMQEEQNQVDDYLKVLDFCERVVQAENDLIIMFTSGMTAAMENRLLLGAYDMDRELLKQLGKEIRETEAEIEKIKTEFEEKNINELSEPIRNQLTAYEQHIRAIRAGQIDKTVAGAGRIVTETGEGNGQFEKSVIGYAERISTISREIEESIARLGEAKQYAAMSDRRISEHQCRDVAEKILESKKGTRRAKRY